MRQVTRPVDPVPSKPNSPSSCRQAGPPEADVWTWVKTYRKYAKGPDPWHRPYVGCRRSCLRQDDRRVMCVTLSP